MEGGIYFGKDPHTLFNVQHSGTCNDNKHHKGNHTHQGD
jgi:hypothetical protein